MGRSEAEELPKAAMRLHNDFQRAYTMMFAAYSKSSHYQHSPDPIVLGGLGYEQTYIYYKLIHQ
jgi:hypothetical protein